MSQYKYFLNALIGSLFLLSAPISQAQQVQDLCQDVLVLAAHNDYSSLSTGSMQSDLRNAMCSDYQSKHNSNNEGHATVDVPLELNGSGGVSQSEYDQIRKNDCSSSSSNLSTGDYQKVLQSVVDDDAIDAWKDCMDHGGTGVRGLIEVDGQLLVLTVWWQPGNDGLDQTTVESSQLNGADGCDHWPAEGTVLDSHKLVRQCKREGDDEVIYTVQAKNGETELKIPKVTHVVSDPIPATPITFAPPTLFATTPNGLKQYQLVGLVDLPVDITQKLDISSAPANSVAILYIVNNGTLLLALNIAGPVSYNQNAGYFTYPAAGQPGMMVEPGVVVAVKPSGDSFVLHPVGQINVSGGSLMVTKMDGTVMPITGGIILIKNGIAELVQPN